MTNKNRSRIGWLLIVLSLAAGCVVLTGCAGTVDSALGRTTAGSAAVTSRHVDGHACPDFSAQGAVDATDMTATCIVANDGTTTETFHVGAVTATQALSAALDAQVKTNGQVTDVVSKLGAALIPIAESAAGAAFGIPISPIRPATNTTPTPADAVPAPATTPGPLTIQIPNASVISGQ